MKNVNNIDIFKYHKSILYLMNTEPNLICDFTDILSTLMNETGIVKYFSYDQSSMSYSISVESNRRSINEIVQMIYSSFNNLIYAAIKNPYYANILNRFGYYNEMINMDQYIVSTLNLQVISVLNMSTEEGIYTLKINLHN